MIIINEKAHIIANEGGGYELFIDAIVNTKEKGQEVKRMGGKYYSTLASALNSYVEHELRILAKDNKPYMLNEVLEKIKELKESVITIYQNHIK